MSLLLVAPIAIGAAAAAGSVLVGRSRATLLGAGCAAFAFGLYLVVGGAGGTGVSAPFWSVPSLGIAGGLKLDGLSRLFALLITGIGALVFLYAGRYLAGDERLGRLTVMLLVFMTAMLGAVTADDVVTLFIFWELTSLASFFLVGFDHQRPGARKAALQALLVTGGGGLALLAGLILVSVAAGTTSLTGILAAREAVLAHPAAVPAMLLVILGCFTKSAQAPFHFWLPNAMAAPTPVSAYLHSATMVKLGIYLLARLNPLYTGVDLWHAVLTWGGLSTAAMGALLALRETDLKRVLAYTTVTALGTLTMLIGIAPALSATAAVTFLLVHALYKASLFLVAGIVDHETGCRDLSGLGGLRRSMPVTAAVAALAAFSMAGLPPFVGFVAKELVYEAKMAAGPLAGVLVAVGFLVNVVMVAIAGVLSWRVFFGAPTPMPKAPHDPPAAMVAGPVILALAGFLAGAAPGLVGAALVDPAVTAMLGEPAAVSLKLWHGFNAVLGLSAATLVLGVGLFLVWERILPRLQRFDAIDRFGATRAYDRALAAVLAGAAGATRVIQHGELKGYLQTLFAVTAVSILAVLALRGGFAWPAFEPGSLDVRGLAFVGVALGALATVLAPTIFSAVVASGLVGFATAVVFLLFGAPDVAFTQFAVETLLVVMLATALIRLPVHQRDVRPARERRSDAVLAGTVGLAFAALLAAVLASPFDPRLSLWFGEQSVPAAHGRNVVNVILVDFRALDTLGEIAVLAIAAVAVAALLRPRREAQP